MYPFQTSLYLIKWHSQGCICTRFCLYCIDDIFPSTYCQNVRQSHAWRPKPKGFPTVYSIESFNQSIFPVVTPLPSCSCYALISFFTVFFALNCLYIIKFWLFNRCHFVSDFIK